jgi:hypothetical protein
VLTPSRYSQIDVRNRDDFRYIHAAHKDLCLVPQNETAHEVACGNDPRASSVETWESEG